MAGWGLTMEMERSPLVGLGRERSAGCCWGGRRQVGRRGASRRGGGRERERLVGRAGLLGAEQRSGGPGRPVGREIGGPSKLVGLDMRGPGSPVGLEMGGPGKPVGLEFGGPGRPLCLDMGGPGRPVGRGPGATSLVGLGRERSAACCWPPGPPRGTYELPEVGLMMGGAKPAACS